MKCGKTNYDVGTRVIVSNLKGEDAEFNGLTGYLTHRFPGVGDGTGDVGVRIDEPNRLGCDALNLNIGEFNVLMTVSDLYAILDNLLRTKVNPNAHIFLSSDEKGSSFLPLLHESSLSIVVEDNSITLYPNKRSTK